MPSLCKGCQNCKVRRIKCDGTHPVCLQCIKSKRVCDGTGDARDLAVFHIENQYASGRKKRPRGPRSAGVASQIGHPRPTLPSTPPDLDALAVAYYVRCHLQSPSDNPDTVKSLLHCVLPRWSKDAQSAHHQIVRLAISSKALATFSRTQKCTPAAVEASSKYGQLLCMAYETMAHLCKDNLDACLLAIFFMSRYEEAIYTSAQIQSSLSVFSTLQSFAHHDGAFAVLKLWKYRFSHVQPPSDIVKLTRRGLIRSALLRNQQIPQWMLDGGPFGETGLALAFDRVVVQITNIRNRLRQLLANQHVDFEIGNRLAMIKDLCKETEATDEALQLCAASLATLWPFTQHKLSTTGNWSPQKYFYSPTVFSYSSSAFAGVWAYFYSTRMLVLSTWMSILEDGLLDDEKAILLQKDLDLMAENLSSSLPFCLQRFTVTVDPVSTKSHNTVNFNKSKEIEPCLASLMIWPLSLASSLKHVDAKHQSWFRSVLAQLGHVIGVSMFDYATTERWPVF